MAEPEGERTLSLSPDLSRGATLYTYLYEKEMRINENENALKGQHILAQGSALGLEASREIVRATAFIKRKLVVSDEKDALLFPEKGILQFRPKGIIYFVHRTSADGFSPASHTQGDISVRSSLNITLG